MKKVFIAALVVLSTVASGLASEEFQTASKLALENARKLSLEGDYAAAAATANEVITTFKAKPEASDSFRLGYLVKAASVYEARAEAARDSAKDRKAARALLNSLLDANPPFEVEIATADDKRVAALLVQLRKNDPKARKFFSARPVKVVVTGEALSESDADALVEGVIGPLRSLGFVASAKEGTETLTLAVSLGRVITNEGPDGPLGPTFPATAESCELKVDALWTVGESPLIRFDLSKRGIGFSDIPGQCVKSRIKEISGLIAPRLVKRWDSDYAP